VDWHKNRRVEATNSRSQGRREGKKGKVSTPGDGKRSKEPKSMEAKAEQTEENGSPKVRDVPLELGSALGFAHRKNGLDKHNSQLSLVFVFVVEVGPLLVCSSAVLF